MRSKHPSQQGLVDLIIIVVIALLLLRYAGVDLKALLASDNAKAVGTYLINLAKMGLDDFKIIFEFFKGLLSGAK